MTSRDVDQDPARHPWRSIGLEVYESHIGDERVGQLEQLHTITAEQLECYPARVVGFLGVAGGNGLDRVDVDAVDQVIGYDVNPAYLSACETRYRDRFGARLRLLQSSITRSLRVGHVDLLLANLIVEYVGVEEFVAFLVANAPRVGVVSCVVQRNNTAGFVSPSAHVSAFAGLSSIAADVDPDAFDQAMLHAGFAGSGRWEYPLPSGKTLLRQDFRINQAEDQVGR